jgi:transcriptional regulator with XRE-family HTH domain
MTLSSFLEAARADRGISQAELARRLGVGRSRLNNWFRGHASPEGLLLPSLCTELALDVADIRTLYSKAGIPLPERLFGGEP